MNVTDPITHGLIGAAITTLSGHSLQLNDPVFLGCTLGAMLPDLDIVAHFKGRLNYLLKHRGASHSIIALTGMALGLSTLIYTIYPTTSWNSIFFWTLVGTFSHGIADLLNSYGAKLLWPFFPKKITVDMIIVTDPLIFISLFISLVVSFKYPLISIYSTITAIGFSFLYLSLRQLSRLKIRNYVMKFYKIKDKSQIKILPAMYKPFSWNFLILQEKVVRFGTFRNGKPTVLRVLPRWDDKNPHIATALEGSLAEIFNQFTPYYHIVTQKNENESTKVHFLDLRYWVNENFLYSGQVIMNEQGEIENETFYPFPNQEGILLGY